MIFRNYNDFEIISLIKQGDEIAFRLMVDKYHYFIAKKINQFNLSYDFDDIYQEALMLLHRSIIKFDESFDKTFTRFFELNLTNYLISYKRKKNREYDFIQEKLPLYDHLGIQEPVNHYFLEQQYKFLLDELSEFEKTVFEVKIIKNKTVRETALSLDVNEKRVYNALDRIKTKVKLHLIA